MPRHGTIRLVAAIIFCGADNQIDFAALSKKLKSICGEIEVRWFMVAAVLVLNSVGVHASDAIRPEDWAGEVAAPKVATPVLIGEAAVVVSPIPMPAMVTERIRELSPSEMRPAKKLKVAKKKTLPAAMLSRTERHQMALLASNRKPGEASLLELFHNEDAGSGAENLDLHRSFNRPRVIERADQDEGRDEGEDSDISEAVKLRLFIARMRAVEAHQKKFS